VQNGELRRRFGDGSDRLGSVVEASESTLREEIAVTP